ncbi:MAG TPA: hypothetical protein VE198_25070 [Actinoallomurus sp.]|jgi:hypothetical protein|nr:hypothetical protein [Actinoallomurus sp.]
MTRFQEQAPEVAGVTSVGPLQIAAAAYDDDSAIRVRGDKVDVVSTGRWRLVGR